MNIYQFANVVGMMALKSRRKSSSFDLNTILIIVGAVVAVAIVVLILVTVLGKKKNTPNTSASATPSPYGNPNPYGTPDAYNNPYGNQGMMMPEIPNIPGMPGAADPSPVNPYMTPDPMMATPDAQASMLQIPSVETPATPVSPAMQIPGMQEPSEKTSAIQMPVLQTPEAPVEKKTYVKLVNVQNGATYEAPLGEQLTIGKRECGINIPDDNSISGTHCQIYMYETNYVLADMESTNGTKLNDYKIDGPVFIENGSILGIGKQKFTVTFEQK